MTHFERTAHEVATQARESIAAGLGMTEFFAWAAGFVMGQRGHSYEECEAIILPAWENAFDEARDRELSA